MTLSKEEIAAVAELCYEDPVEFCKTFLEEWFPGPIPWFHRAILAIILRKTDFLLKYGELDKITRNFVYKVNPEDPSSAQVPIFRLECDETISMVVSRNTLLMIPRGYAKTTLMNACALYLTIYRDRQFPIYLSETATHAENQLGNVKKQYELNEKLRLVFGDLVPTRQEPQKWTSDQIEPKSGCVFVARGRGGQVRGLNIDARRPDLILVDDVENEESVLTSEQLEKTRKWFYEAVMPAIAEMNPDANIFAVGTLLHKDALLMQLARDPEWTTIILSAEDVDGNALWPEMLSLEKLARKKAQFIRVGNLGGFYREYYNRIRDESTQKFRPEYIRVGSLKDEIVLKALCCDPAIAEKRRNSRKQPDFHAQAVVGMTEHGHLIVLAADGRVGLTPREQVDWYFEWHFKYGLTTSDRHGIEGVAYQQALIHLVREEMFRKKTYFEIESIQHREAKLTRVEGVLQPRYAAGYITHAAHFPLLEEQLLDWPNGKLDLPDVVAMAVTLLAPAAAYAGMETGDLADDEYEPLSRVIGNWRSAP